MALAQKPCPEASWRHGPHLCFDVSLTIDLDPNALADLESINAVYFTAVKGHVDEAYGYFAVVRAVNDGIDRDFSPFIPWDPALPVLHNSNSVGPHQRSERHS